ncbi:MAG: sensor histidine kinase [Ignavibacteriales bacterium]
MMKNNAVDINSEMLSIQLDLYNRTPEDEILRQSLYFIPPSPASELIDAVPDIVMVLNKQRQTVFVNKSLLRYFDKDDEKEVLGCRPGEIFRCTYSYYTAGGCGTSEFCRTCGAAKAIINSQKGFSDVQECRITQKDTNDALDLRVWTTPITINQENFTIFIVADISDEKRRYALERIFFHDIMNILSGLLGNAELLNRKISPDNAQYSQRLLLIAERLIDEIEAQRELSAAENNELVINPTAIDSKELLTEIFNLYIASFSTSKRKIEIDVNAASVNFTSDRLLLRRVIGNMIKNAIEACPVGGTVTAGCRLNGNRIEFWVNNPAFMDRDVQLQIFQRSFSTKGVNRGLGTYSMKLLSERYLNGNIRFTSSESEGTTFICSYPV